MEKILPYETESDYAFRNEICKADPLIIEAVDTLGIAKVRSLRYITKNLKLAIYKAKCKSPQVTELIHDYFKVGGRYLLTDIKAKSSKSMKNVVLNPKKGSRHRLYINTLTVSEPPLRGKKDY